jgi:hypothetical protein
MANYSWTCSSPPRPSRSLKPRCGPIRFNGVYGTAHAAELAGDRAKARTYYGHLVALCTQADTARPELMAAKAFLAKQ